jgi:hypothetical protein
MTGIIFFVYVLNQQRPVTFISASLQVWYTAEQRVKRPTYINRDHAFCGPCPASKHLSDAWQLTDLAVHIHPITPFLVNIGAASIGGGQYDPTYPLLTISNSSFGALLIDPNSDPTLFHAYPNRSNVRITHDFIWSESVVQDIFQKYQVSKAFTILKVDIDSYECSILESILRADYRPQLIHTEFNPIFPPPIIFMPIYNSTTKNDWQPSLWTNNGPFYGCSLSALSKLLLSFDYILLQVEFWDVIYIQRQTARSSQIQVPANDHIAYTHGFLNHSCLPYCRGNLKLYNDHIANGIKSSLNQSNFTAHMTSIMDSFAPVSSKNNLRHPYIINV